MLAIDTNVVVRFLTGDEPKQGAAARRLLERQDVLVLPTVLLEAEWVLRSGYGLGRDDVLAALRGFCGLPRVTVADPARVAKAFEFAGAGLDFADALHLAGALECEGFATFDRRLAKVRAEGAPSITLV